MNIINLSLAFLEGIGLVLSPCILPILPIVLAAGVEGGRRRPYGIILGFVLAFTAFSLLSRSLIQFLGIDVEWLRFISIVFLVLFGIILFSNYLSAKFSIFSEGLATWGAGLNIFSNRKDGLITGVGIGIAIGFIWTPCAGPIMAAAIVEVIRAKTSLESGLTMLAFALGAGVPMLILILGGRKIMAKATWFKRHSDIIRKVLGGVIILAAILSTQTAEIFLNTTVNRLIAAGPQNVSATKSSDSMQLIDPISSPYKAPEIGGISDWINSAPLKISDLKGKVVLIDFWTYSCINCVRTLPYITAWDQKYKGKGLVIIGIHSPEFEFEKKQENVKKAVLEHNIHYSVGLDNELTTWTNFSNQYWPAHYLINKEGEVVYTHFGEGDYDVTEHNIQSLLGVSDQPIAVEDKPGHPYFKAFMLDESPETYLGAERAARYVGHGALVANTTVSAQYGENMGHSRWSLQGNWQIGSENITAAKADAGLKFHFVGKKVFLVMGPPKDKIVKVQIKLNGQPIGLNAGADVKNSEVTVDRQTLYELVNLKEFGEGELEIIAPEGLQAYAFTFGAE